MSMLKCWFWKKKKKQCKKENDYFEEGPKIIYAVPQVVSGYDFNRPNKAHRRNSDSFNYKNTYQVPNIHKKREIKSYPTSPVKANRENSQDVRFKHSVPMVYVANMPGPSSLRLSQSPPAPAPAPEPFPFEIPKPEDTLPRRSSLFYGVRNINVNDMPVNPLTSLTREENNPEKHVTIKLPDNNEAEEDVDVSEQVKRTTVVRLRPSSIVQPPGEYVKQMTVRASITDPQPSTPGKLVVNMPVKPSKDSPVLITSGGKKLKPLGTDKIRTSITRDPQRASVVRQSVTKDSGLRTSQVSKQGMEQTVCPVPVMQTKRNSITRGEGRKSITRHEPNVNERRDSVRARDDSTYLFNKNNQSPMVYAVPTVPTRGRSRSILHQSIKSFTSRESADLSAINKKNIRRSVDTDVFSTQSQRKSVQRNQPGYVNMERGQTVLVSELLNPISSIFVTDLKDPVPKDPQNKPREYNNLAKPKRHSVQPMPKQSQPERKIPQKAPVIVYQGSRSKQTRNNRYRDESSSSDESIEVYRKKSRRSHQNPSQNRYAVYSTHVDPVLLSQDTTESGKNPPFKKKGKPVVVNNISTSINDYCGLNVEPPEGRLPRDSYSISRPQVVSSAQQTDVEDDEMDLLCYPADRLLKDYPLATESGSKLRWRIIIKR